MKITASAVDFIMKSLTGSYKMKKING